MPQDPEKEFDKVYRPSGRIRENDEYVSFLAAAIEESEDVIIDTSSEGDIRKLPLAMLKGLFYFAKDRDFSSFGKGLDHLDTEYDDSSWQIVQKFENLSSNTEKFGHSHTFYFKQKQIPQIADTIKQLDSKNRTIIEYAKGTKNGFYFEIRPINARDSQKVYINEGQEEKIEKINEKLEGKAELVPEE